MTFGDISLISKVSLGIREQEPRKETAITSSYCELLTLSKSDFNRILTDFPKDANDIILECQKKREYLENSRKEAESNSSLKPIFKQLLKLRSSWMNSDSINTSLLQFSPRKSFLSDRGETTQQQITTTIPTQSEKEQRKSQRNLLKKNQEQCSSPRLFRAWETGRIDQEDSKSQIASLTEESSSLMQSLKAQGSAQESIRQLIEKIEESASMLAGVMETVCRQEGIIKRTVQQTSNQIDALRKEQNFLK